MTFILTIVLTLAFGGVMYIWDFGIIDEMYDSTHISQHIEAMSQSQRHVHAWMTATLDVAYPLVYGAFYIGVTLKAFKRFGFWLALPAMLVIPVDLIEGVAQVFLLTGHEDFMDLKITVTPVKLVLYILALLIALIGLVRMGVGKIKK